MAGAWVYTSTGVFQTIVFCSHKKRQSQELALPYHPEVFLNAVAILAGIEQSGRTDVCTPLI